MDTTRSRRSWNSFWCGLMKSWVPLSASTAAYCEIEQGLEVVWVITLPMALISGSGPPQ